MSPSSLVSVLAHVGKPGQTLAIPLPSAMSSAVIILSAKPTVMTTRLLLAPGHAYVPGLRTGWLVLDQVQPACAPRFTIPAQRQAMTSSGAQDQFQ